MPSITPPPQDSLHTLWADIQLAGVAGTGSVGASWITAVLARERRVLAWDPDPGAPRKVRDFVNAAWPAVKALAHSRLEQPPLELLAFAPHAAALGEAQFIMEAAPERPALKSALFRELDAVAPAAVVIGSSTGGMKLSTLQQGLQHPGRVVLMHPLNPAHLVPLVEIGGSPLTDPATVEWAVGFARWLGKAPVVLRREVTGHVSNRLQAALMREAINCLVEGVASAEDIDTVVTHGLGARWAAIGPLMTLHLSGGQGGTQAMLDHAGEAIAQWWADLGTPSLTPDVRAAMVAAGAELQGTSNMDELMARRDAKLVELLGSA